MSNVHNDPDSGVIIMTEKNHFYKVEKLTRVVISPKAKIATFWTTHFRYYVISKVDDHNSILRVGKISCEKPAIITPETLINSFEGFSPEDVQFAEYLSGEKLAKVRILGYQFKNQLESKRKISTTDKILIQNIKKQEKGSLNNTAILSAPSKIWSLSITKLAMDTIFRSFPENVRDLEERGFFMNEDEKINQEIEILFSIAEEEKCKKTADELGRILQESNLFEKYEDRFFELVSSI